MLPKKYRANKGFFRNFKKTGDFSSEHFYLKLSPTELDHSVFAFIVSSKCVKRAVDRNTLKRRARHIIAKKLSQTRPGFCVMVYFRTQSDRLKYREIEQELTNLLKKAKILK